LAQGGDALDGVALESVVPKSVQDRSQWRFVELSAASGRFVTLSDGGKKYADGALRLIAHDGRLDFMAHVEVNDKLPQEVQNKLRAQAPRLENVNEIRIYTNAYVPKAAPEAQAFVVVDAAGKEHPVSLGLVMRLAKSDTSDNGEAAGGGAAVAGDDGRGRKKGKGGGKGEGRGAGDGSGSGDDGGTNAGADEDDGAAQQRKKPREMKRGTEVMFDTIFAELGLLKEGAAPERVVLASGAGNTRELRVSEVRELRVRLGQQGKLRAQWRNAEGEDVRFNELERLTLK